MSRATRVEYEGACYHVMSRGVARTRMFLDDDDHHSFLEILGGQVESGAFEVHGFCQMPNHYHLLLRTHLRNRYHVPFKRGALGIDDDHRILISEHVRGATGIDDWLLKFLGEPLRRPLAGRPEPAVSYLQWHREQVFRQPARELSQ